MLGELAVIVDRMDDVRAHEDDHVPLFIPFVIFAEQISNYRKAAKARDSTFMLHVRVANHAAQN